MPMQWNEQADAKLFANVLKIHVAKIDYQALAKAMGDTVTPKAISHRISKIKEKAQVRRFDWELYSNPPTSLTSKKRGPKTKTLNDDEDSVAKKRIKNEDPIIKVEENVCGSDDRTSGDPEASGQCYQVNEWQSITDPGQQFYGLYPLEEPKVNGIYDVDYTNPGGSCENSGVGQDSIDTNYTVAAVLGGSTLV